MENLKSYRWLLFLLIFSTAIFRICYVMWGPLDLGPDEAQYWDWSRRLDLSYYSKGPAIAYIIALTTSILGSSEIGVRIGAVILSSAITGLMYMLTRMVSGSTRAAFYAALVLQATPLFSVGALLMTTDMPYLFFWGLSVYLFYRAVEEGKTLYWLLTGAAVGLGLLSKYTMALIYPLFFLFLLFPVENRRWLKRCGPYLALMMSLVFFFPVISWNAEHGWATFRHVMGQAHVGGGLNISFKDFFEFLGSQASVLTPLIFLGVIYGMYRTGVEGVKGRRAYFLLFLTSAPVLLFFLFKSLQGKVQANWAASAYFTGIIATAVVMDEIFLKREEGKSLKGLTFLVRFAIITSLLLIVIAHIPQAIYAMPFKKDPAAQLKGWEEIGKEVGKVYTAMSEEHNTFILSDKYQITSELAFYVPDNPVTYNINLGRRMNQYDIWEGFYALKGWNTLYVEWNGDPLRKQVRELFKTCFTEPVLEIVRGGKVIRKFTLHRCYGFKGMKVPEFVEW